MVEFVLILFPLLILVAGIIQFGIALNYWLDMQRVANQGARWATVNNWPPDCSRTTPEQACAAEPACDDPNRGTTQRATLQNTLYCQAIADGLQRNACIRISYTGTEEVGQPVKVEMKTQFNLVPILGVGMLKLGADATMRLEQRPTLITGEGTWVQGEDGIPCPY